MWNSVYGLKDGNEDKFFTTQNPLNGAISILYVFNVNFLSSSFSVKLYILAYYDHVLRPSILCIMLMPYIWIMLVMHEQ